GLTDELVNQAFRDTRTAEFADARREMLRTLYEHAWRPADGATASHFWLALSLLLLENHEADRAAQVMTLADDPTDVILVHADQSFKPLLKAAYFETDPRQAERSRVSALRAYVRQHPRSLHPLNILLQELLDSKEDEEVLKMAAGAEDRIRSAAKGAPA